MVRLLITTFVLQIQKILLLGTLLSSGSLTSTKVDITSVKLFVQLTIQLDHLISPLWWTTEPSSQTKRSAFQSLTTIQNHGTQLGLLLILLWVASPFGCKMRKLLVLFTTSKKMIRAITERRLLGNQVKLY